MKNNLVGILFGLAICVVAARIMLRHAAAAEPAKTEAAAPADKPKEKENPLHLPPAKVLAGKSGDHALSVAEMEWQLEFFGAQS